jgi:NAD(P)-dependent dehydrogenase (short-subunit alcohol dehydrogenase family)
LSNNTFILLFYIIITLLVDWLIKYLYPCNSNYRAPFTPFQKEIRESNFGFPKKAALLTRQIVALINNGHRLQKRNRMMFNLDGHVALITGGNGGIGLAFARGLLKSGASVAIWGRNKDKNEAALAELKDLGGQAAAFICDVTEESQIKDAFTATIAHFGKVDSCFANAGGSGGTGFLHQVDNETWNSAMDLNVNSVVNTFRPTIAHLLERKAPGKLVVTSSIAALMGTGLHAPYSTTKAAVIGLVRALAVELGTMGITANALLPGYIESDLTAATSQAFQDAAKRRACLGRVGTVEDMEGVAVFLASRHSDYMTGSAMVMDGGHTIHPL